MKRIISYVNSNPPLNSTKREKVLSRTDFLMQDISIDFFCFERSYTIVKKFRDKCPTNNFSKRPAWKKLMKYVNDNKENVDEILISRWDRFSISRIEADIQISELKRLGVRLNAVEQPINIYNRISDVSTLKIDNN